MTEEATELELELPDYHGRKPSGMKTSITGSGNRIQRAHEIGDRVVIVLEAKCKKAGHEDTEKDGLLYAESFAVVDFFEIPGVGGSKLIRFLRSSDRAAKDLAEGKEPLPEMGEQGWTDASGVVLTREELAERRGDPLTFLVGTPEAAVIVYEDGSKALWPDEFMEGADRPALGSVGLQGSPVVDVLDAETGESLEGSDVEQERRGAVDDEAEEIVVAERVEADEDAQPFAELPDLPEADDEFDIGEDELEPFESDDFETDDFESDVPPLPDELPDSIGDAADELEQRLPIPEDFAFVDCSIAELDAKLSTEAISIVQARRLVEAEKQGRGRGLKARKGALELLRNRLAAMEAELAHEIEEEQS